MRSPWLSREYEKSNDVEITRVDSGYKLNNKKINLSIILNEDEYWQALLAKDNEELLEVKNANSLLERKEELADKLELIIAMAKYNGFSLQDIIDEANKKREKNGGFEKRIFLEKVIKK